MAAPHIICRGYLSNDLSADNWTRQEFKSGPGPDMTHGISGTRVFVSNCRPERSGPIYPGYPAFVIQIAGICQDPVSFGPGLGPAKIEQADGANT